MTVRQLLVSLRIGVTWHRIVIAAMYVPGTPGGEEHFDAHHHQDRYHRNEAGHGGIPIIPERWEARVSEGDEGGREEMHKGGSDEDSGAEVTGEEEEVMGNWKAGKSAHYDRKRACCNTVVRVANTTGARSP